MSNILDILVMFEKWTGIKEVIFQLGICDIQKARALQCLIRFLEKNKILKVKVEHARKKWILTYIGKIRNP